MIDAVWPYSDRCQLSVDCAVRSAGLDQQFTVMHFVLIRKLYNAYVQTRMMMFQRVRILVEHSVTMVPKS